MRNFIIAAVIAASLSYWTGFAAVGLLLVYGAFIIADRWLPERMPDPDGAQLLKELEEHREFVQKELRALHGKLDLRNTTRLLRE